MWLHSQLDRAFVDDVRGGVIETERGKQARQGQVQWRRGMGVRAPVLPKDMDTEGAKAMSLRWIDTDKGDAGRPKQQVWIGRERNQESHEEIRCSLCG